jgi:hypothetical protein
MIMNMTVATSHVKQIAPQVLTLKEGQTALVVLKSSASPTGTKTVTFKRLTEGYFYLSDQ